MSLRGFGDWLKGGLRLPWGDLATQAIDATTATADLGEVWQEAAPKLEKLKDLDRIDSFFKLFDSPATKLAVAGLPFASMGIELLRLYWDVTKTEPTFESSVVLAAQMAYLESLGGVIERADRQTKAKLERVKLATVFERQLQRGETMSLSKTRAKKTLTQLRRSELAEAFDEVLAELLGLAGLVDWQVKVFVDQVAWGTPKYLHGVVAELKDEVEPLADFLRSDGLQIQERFDSIEDYLVEEIDPLPQQQVFDEADPLATFSDLYVPLKVQPLDITGKEANESALGIHDWAKKLLEQSEPRKVGFIEGEAGRGKSVFCRMFAAMVRIELSPAFVPILIRLRDVRVLENNLSQTLATHLQELDFVQSDRGWLTDENTRFLLIFDGFDELLLQGRNSGGLKELIQQLGDFQKNSHHQCLVTGRPLALQGADRALSQTNNLSRVRLEPMADAQREEWLANWVKLFGEVETENFKTFLSACPTDIGKQLACEPLLMYLLGRLHREKHLNAGMFVGTEGIRAKVRVYDESVKWVLERQRQEVSEQISGLVTEDLRQVLQEAALCVVQSGNETAKLTMLKSRFMDDANPVAELLKQSQTETEKTEDKTLNNLLTAFYLRPGEGDRVGSVEFAHKSFGEFLFAERLKVAFEDWTELDKRQRPRLNDADVARQIYDLLGYGPLTVEIVDYLKELLFNTSEWNDLLRLFRRLHQFYENWCEGFYIDKASGGNLPQAKMMQLRAMEIEAGMRQVDIHAGLNTMILLFELHRYGQRKDDSQDHPLMNFHPCGIFEKGSMRSRTLRRIMGYSQLIQIDYFMATVGHFLRSSNLSGADLNEMYFVETDLSYADLRDAEFGFAQFFESNLSFAKLSNANFNGASLQEANLEGVIATNANLSCASITYANLRTSSLTNVDLDGTDLYGTNLSGADLTNAFLGSTDLRNANLSGANFNNAELIGADISGSNISNADFSNADLDKIHYDKQVSWHQAKGLEKARNLPEAIRQELNLAKI